MERKVSVENIVRMYLSREEILEDKVYRCSFDNCFTMLHNLANLQMHLARHHNVPAMSPQSGKPELGCKIFYCPYVSCVYYQTPAECDNGARFFSSFRSLKQHYLKVHSERKFGCEACGKSFATASFLRHHHLSCGRKFICDHCSYSYGSREALLTHAKRKQHGYEELLLMKKPHLGRPSKLPKTGSVSTGTQTLSEEVDIMRNRSTELTENRGTQTVQGKRAPELHDGVVHLTAHSTSVGETETSIVNGTHKTHNLGSHIAIEIGSAESLIPVVCTETQTDFIDVMFAHGENRHDPLLSYTHMHTQTCDEPGLFADLGLSTIETQTSWDEEGGESFGDFLVSTETQTNFDIDCFDCTSNSNGDKADQANSKQTQMPEAMHNEFHNSSGAGFLSEIGDSLDHSSTVRIKSS
ncbi:oocyte zinc finger protein XlCOF6 [Anopheles nili]|uniref:oocyte zinc finger protein XlCOF6 n=1 Tax=Anopheles nili TaxID=185578 RepID=UPI00237AD160|nr:oocyte zinc finger protein XlCOF6 [Anopheles nili]